MEETIKNNDKPENSIYDMCTDAMGTLHPVRIKVTVHR